MYFYIRNGVSQRRDFNVLPRSTCTVLQMKQNILGFTSSVTELRLVLFDAGARNSNLAKSLTVHGVSFTATE